MNRPRTIPELFLQAVERHDRPDFMRYKAGGDWTHIRRASSGKKSSSPPTD